MAELPAEARAAIESGALAHLVTINSDGSPQVSCVWAGIDGDELVTAHLAPDQQKLKNGARDPRVALSIEFPTRNAIGLQHYVVVHGRARLTEGGAPEPPRRLAQVYAAQGSVGAAPLSPPMSDPPPGYVMHIAIERVAGYGPWSD